MFFVVDLVFILVLVFVLVIILPVIVLFQLFLLFFFRNFSSSFSFLGFRHFRCILTLIALSLAFLIL